METTTIEGRCNARPTRLAFILPAPNEGLLVHVIAKATTLWGGVFNPIVILDGSTRIVQGPQEDLLSSGGYLEGQAALLEAFDPDFLITFSTTPLPKELAKFQHRTFPHDRLEWRPWNRGKVSHFLEVWPALHGLWETRIQVQPQSSI